MKEKELFLVSETKSDISSTAASQSKPVENEDNDFIIGLFTGIGISAAMNLIAALIFLLRRK